MQAFSNGWRSHIIAVLHPIQRTDHAAPRDLQHMGVNHRGLYVRVAEQFLHATNVVAGLQQVRGETMTQSMGRGRLEDSRLLHRALEIALESLIVHMVPPNHA